MATIEAAIMVSRPAEQVFAFVTDLGKVTQWMTGVMWATQTSTGPMGIGTTYHFDVQVMGRKLETTGEVTGYDPPHRKAWKATSGPFPMSGSTTCEVTPEGTRVTGRIEAEPGGFFKLAEPLLIKQQRDQMEKDLARLKGILEA